MNIACVVTAAGRSARFGEDKLCHAVNGLPMLAHILTAAKAVPFGKRLVVAPSADGAVADLAAAYGFDVAVNDRAELGMSESVRVGTSAVCADADAILFAVGDQPFVTAGTLVSMLRLWREDSSRIVALGHAGRRGNPVIFPRDLFTELQRLTGDVGGASVIAAHPDRLTLCETDDERELWDMDTRGDIDTLC